MKLGHKSSTITYKALKHDSFIEGRTASVLVNGQQVGFFGEIHPQVLANWKIAMPVAVAEIDLAALIVAEQQHD